GAPREASSRSRPAESPASLLPGRGPRDLLARVALLPPAPPGALAEGEPGAAAPLRADDVAALRAPFPLDRAHGLPQVHVPVPHLHARELPAELPSGRHPLARALASHAPDPRRAGPGRAPGPRGAPSPRLPLDEPPGD